MSVTLKIEQLKKDESNSDDHDDSNNDVERKKCKINLGLSYTTKDRLLDNKELQLNKVQNTIIKSQDLIKSDKILKVHKQSEECDLVKSLKSSPSWPSCNSTLDDDVYAITADQSVPSSSLQITSIDGFFNRKRGRPPKNRFVEVYKNTQQRPQAIFTSFKLEKQGLKNYADALSFDDFRPSCETPNAVVDLNLKVCESANKYSIKNSGHKLPNENSTSQIKRLKRAITALSTYDGEKKSTGDSNDFCNTKSYNLNFSTLDDDRKQTEKTVAKGPDKERNKPFDAGPEFKKIKLDATADNVTVIRAAGTFYPQNCREYTCNNSIKVNPVDNITKKQDTLTLSDNEMAQNLSLKDGTKIKTTDDIERSSFNYSLTGGSSGGYCSSAFPQIYNILQMQQQLFAFYQQIALMAPAFSHLAPTLGHTTPLSESCTQLSFTATAGNTTNLLHNKNLINTILNLQNYQQIIQKGTEKDLAVDAKAETTCLSEINKKSTATATKANENSSTPEQNVADRTQQYGKRRTPSGYLRYRFNEDCGYEKCGYRQHQSHFHCNRADCRYSFCDKTRFVQHTARHERLDTLMGSDFQQYRVTMICNYDHCPYAFNPSDGNLNDTIISNRKSSHYHCRKCSFVCADTNKVVAHRRLHNKMELIRLAGFRKVTTKENCMITTEATQFKQQKHLERCVNETLTLHCPYAMRHAHYHCLVCNSSVLSRSQLFSHKHSETVTFTSNKLPQQQSLIGNEILPESHRACKGSKL